MRVKQPQEQINRGFNFDLRIFKQFKANKNPRQYIRELGKRGQKDIKLFYIRKYQERKFIKSLQQNFTVDVAVNKKEKVKYIDEIFRDYGEKFRQFSSMILVQVENFLQSEPFIYICFIMTTAYNMEAFCRVTGFSLPLNFMPSYVGLFLGLHFALLYRFGKVRVWKEPSRSLNVVITGSTRGLGRALAREFVQSGDNVILTSRSVANAKNTEKLLRNENQEVCGKILGLDCDVTSPSSMEKLADTASKFYDGQIDIWINNAAQSDGFINFLDEDGAKIKDIVQTNLLGSIYGVRSAVSAMKYQNGGHIFFVNGAGSNGSATPMYSVYGSTKCAISQLTKTVNKELKADNQALGIHSIQPGMILTDLLLKGSTPQVKQAYNILCEQPETTAAFLVPRIRSVSNQKGGNREIAYLNFWRVLYKIGIAPTLIGRFFDKDGSAKYPESEQERLFGVKSKKTQRLMRNAKVRFRELSVTYALAMSMSYYLIMTQYLPTQA